MAGNGLCNKAVRAAAVAQIRGNVDRATFIAGFLLRKEDQPELVSGFFGSSTAARFALFFLRAGAGRFAGAGTSSAFKVRRWPSYDGGLAIPIILGQDGAKLCGRGRIAERSGHQPQLHAAAAGAFADDDDRLQRRQRCIGARLEQPAPQRAQVRERNWRRRDRRRIRCAGLLASSTPRRIRLDVFARRAQPRRSPEGGSAVTDEACGDGLCGSISFPAAGSGGAIIDLDSTSERSLASLPALRRASLTIVETFAGAGPSGAPPCWARPLPPSMQPARPRVQRIRPPVEPAQSAPLAIAPVTESRPCSSTVTRE